MHFFVGAPKKLGDGRLLLYEFVPHCEVHLFRVAHKLCLSFSARHNPEFWQREAYFHSFVELHVLVSEVGPGPNLDIAYPTKNTCQNFGGIRAREQMPLLS